MKIRLQNKTFSVAEFLDLDLTDENNNWIQDIQSFLLEWYSNEDFIIGHTSGSTGTPKRLCLQKKDMLASAQVTNSFFGISHASRLMLSLSVHYIAGKMMIVRAIEKRCELTVIQPVACPDISSQGQIDLLALVPMQIHNLLQNKSNFDTVNNVIIGGAAVSPHIKELIQDINCSFYESYGMTETVSHIALKALNKNADPYFRTVDQVTVETDYRGCLVINTPHLTIKQLITNDIVKLINNKTFQWLGRYDNVINSGGVKFSPETIEIKIQSFFTQRYFITGKKDKVLGEKIILIIEDEIWPQNKIDELYIYLKKTLTKYEIPKEILFREKFTETVSHKIIREQYL